MNQSKKPIRLSGIDSEGYWKYPFKPVRVSKEKVGSLDPDQYIMERKYDGHRAIAIVHDNRLKLWTRQKNRIEITENLAPQLKELNLLEGTVLDGEIWTPVKRGSWKQNPKVHCQLAFWDIIRDGIDDLSKEPMSSRRVRLEAAIGDKCPDISCVEQLPVSLKLIDEIEKDANSHRKSTDSRSGYVHGVVVKKLKSQRRDHSGRSTTHIDWMKVVFEGMD